jgi:hypothetical protein
VRIPIDKQIICVEREIGMRVDVYARRVAAGSMTPAKAAAELETMRAVLETLREVEASTRLI